MDFPSLTLDWYFLFCSVSFSYFLFFFIDASLYSLIDWFCVCVFFIRYPCQLHSSLFITKMVEQLVPVSCLDIFQHQWVRLWAYGMDRQLGAASVQTVDHGGQAMTSCSLWQDASSWRVTLLIYFASLFFSRLTLANVLIFFQTHLCQSFFVFCYLLIPCFMGH